MSPRQPRSARTVKVGPPVSNESIGERLADLRRQHGLSIRALARQAGGPERRPARTERAQRPVHPGRHRGHHLLAGLPRPNIPSRLPDGTGGRPDRSLPSTPHPNHGAPPRLPAFLISTAYESPLETCFV